MKICTHDDQCRVLLIEDYPDHATLVEIVIQQYGKGGFNLCHHPTLSEGIACITQRSAGPIDIILLDLNLPDSHGLATLQAVLTVAVDVPVVVMTSLDDESLAEAAQEAGAQDYVIKSDILTDRRSLARIMRYSIARNRSKIKSKEQEEKLALVEKQLNDSEALRLVREVREELTNIATRNY